VLQVSSGAEKGGGKSLHELLGRIVGAERSRELEGNVPSGLGASRQVPQHGLSLLDPVLGVAHAQNGLGAGLVPSRIEHEAAGVVSGPRDRPARQNAGEGGDVGLAVAAVDADGVKLEDFAGVVLVQARPPSHAHRGVRPHGSDVVEVGQHGGMLRHRDQHVLEAAENVGTDGLALECAGHERRDAAGFQPDREMVRPERRETFGEADIGAQHRPDSGLYLVQDDGRPGRRRPLGLRLVRHAPAGASPLRSRRARPFAGSRSLLDEPLQLQESRRRIRKGPP
jgi:hypothetical protein